MGTSATMALIPVGTTNVLARILGIPADPVRAAEALVSDPRRIDLAVARRPGQRGNRHRRHHRHLLRRDRARRRHRPAGRIRAVPQVPAGRAALSPHHSPHRSRVLRWPARIAPGGRRRPARRRRRRPGPGPRAVHLPRPVPAEACGALPCFACRADTRGGGRRPDPADPGQSPVGETARCCAGDDRVDRRRPAQHHRGARNGGADRRGVPWGWSTGSRSATATGR